DLTRFQTLGSKGFETQQNLDQQQGKVDTMKATIAADEAQIETAQTQLDYTDIRAPSDGRMGVRLIDPGNVVHASATAPIPRTRLDGGAGAATAGGRAVHAAGRHSRHRARGAATRRGRSDRL